jgi:GntR family transcriptional regulator, transcriptional repressor for pyruvate dehydrogenase complex
MAESRQVVSLRSGGALDVPPLDTPSASDGVARLIRGLIFSAELSPGDWLPPGRDLAERLGISQLTLRVGLRSLETNGYLVTSRGAHGGTRVGDIETLGRIWVSWMESKADEVRDMWEYREIVECHVAMFAAQRRTPQELAAIESALASAAADGHTAVLRWNVSFHDALAAAAHSSHLARAVVSVRQELFLPAGLLLREHPADELRAAHAEVYAAVRDQHPAHATECMRSHLEGTREMVARSLDELRGRMPRT